MIVLGIDWGRARTGVARSDEMGLLAHPVAVLEGLSGEGLVAAVARLAAEQKAARVVVGLPRNMDGSEGDSAAQARRFAENLEKAASVPVVMWDERLSTWEAERRLRETGAGGGKGRRDRAAACVILQSYLDAERASGGRS